MRNFLSDPIWQFVGSTIAFAALLASIYVFFLQKRKKSLCYEILTDTDLLTIDEEIKGNIKIVFDGIPIQNVSLVILRVLNDGNIPITSLDFEKSLTFSFGISSIISSEIIRKSPTTLSPELRMEPSQIELKPMLLNSKDSITIKLLVAQYGRIINADARIVGVREVKKIDSKRGRIIPLVLIGLPFLIFVYLSLLLTMESVGLSLLPSIMMVTVFFATVAFVIVSLAREYRRRA